MCYGTLCSGDEKVKISALLELCIPLGEENLKKNSISVVITEETKQNNRVAFFFFRKGCQGRPFCGV